MHKSPSSEPDVSSGNLEISCILRDPKIDYHVHKSPPLVPVLNQMNSMHSIPSCFFEKHCNIICPSMPKSSNLSLSFKPSHQNSVCTSPLPHMHHLPCPTHSPWFCHWNNVWWQVQIMKILTVQFFFQALVTSSHFGPHVFLSSLFSNSPILCSHNTCISTFYELKYTVVTWPDQRRCSRKCTVCRQLFWCQR